jgi:hypothetical protein
MRRFLIKVNGVAYDVEVDEAGQTPQYMAPAVMAPVAAILTGAAAPAATAAIQAAPAPSAAAQGRTGR